MTRYDNVAKIAKSLKKDYGDIQVMSQDTGFSDFVSTGNLAFDLISDGGIPFGVGTELIGLSASGKSLFCQQAVADAQEKYDAVGVVVDRENAWTKTRSEELGIDSEGLIKAYPTATETITDAFSFIIDTVESIRKIDKEQYIVGIIDSIAAFDKDVDLDKSDSGRRAKSTKDGYRKLFSILDKKVMILIVNHFYYAIGQLFGDPRKESGGEGLKYFNTVRFALEDRKKIIDPTRDGEVIGNWIGIEVIKTRLGPCFRTCYVPHYYERGIDYYGGYGRLLAHRGYLKPKNKKEFKPFKQSTLLYEEGEKSREVDEHKIEKFLEDHPELLFTEFPPYKGTSEETKKDGYIEEPVFEEVEEYNN